VGIRCQCEGSLQKSLCQYTSISQLEQDEVIETFDTELWAQQLDLQWEKRFEQRESLTEDRVIQVDVGSQAHPKPISISESLTFIEREKLIALIRKYIDVFAWSYEDMPGLDPQIAMHRLNIKPDAKPVQQQQRFVLTSRKLLKLRSINSSNIVSFVRSSTQTGLLTLSPFLRRMK